MDEAADVLLTRGDYTWALDLAHDADPQVAFRSSYALELAMKQEADPSRITPHLPQLLSNYLTVTNGSAHRHYSKWIHRALLSGQLRLNATEENQVAERCFEFLIDPQTKSAVKAWAMDTLLWLSDALPWIEQELYDTIQHLMQEGSPAIQSRGSRVCRAIRKKRRERSSSRQ